MHIQKKPIIGLAPMDGITDAAFRFIVDKYGKPDLLYTEFVSVDGLHFGRPNTLNIFKHHNSSTPLIAQLVGNDPNLFYKAAQTAAENGCDGVDINMGCPDTGTMKKGSGAGLIRTPDTAKKIIAEVKKAACDVSEKNGKKIPVSVKTRIGYEEPITKEWMNNLIDARPDMIVLHGRTAIQKYTGRADWDEIGIAGRLVKKTGIIFLGNGDIQNKDEAMDKIKTYKIDGVLIGRAALGNPWIFSETTPNLKTRFAIMIEHCKKFQEFRPDMKNIIPMRKHLAWYCCGFDGSAKLRDKMMKVIYIKDAENILQSFLLDIKDTGVNRRT